MKDLILLTRQLPAARRQHSVTNRCRPTYNTAATRLPSQQQCGAERLSESHEPNADGTLIIHQMTVAEQALASKPAARIANGTNRDRSATEDPADTMHDRPRSGHIAPTGTSSRRSLRGCRFRSVPPRQADGGRGVSASVLDNVPGHVS
jgi:hypothetical protein